MSIKLIPLPPPPPPSPSFWAFRINAITAAPVLHLSIPFDGCNTLQGDKVGDPAGGEAAGGSHGGWRGGGPGGN